MLLMIDNYDSFVYNLVRYFEELGEEIKVVRNDKITIKEIKEMNIDGIVIWQASDGEVFQSVNGSDFMKIANGLQEYIDIICE